jgi:hypothetical protein
MEEGKGLGNTTVGRRSFFWNTETKCSSLLQSLAYGITNQKKTIIHHKHSQRKTSTNQAPSNLALELHPWFAKISIATTSKD